MLGFLVESRLRNILQRPCISYSPSRLLLLVGSRQPEAAVKWRASEKPKAAAFERPGYKVKLAGGL